MALSPDGNYLAVLAWMYPANSEDQADRDSEFRVYNLPSGNLQAGFLFRGTLQDVVFSPDSLLKEEVPVAVDSAQAPPLDRSLIQMKDYRYVEKLIKWLKILPTRPISTH